MFTQLSCLLIDPDSSSRQEMANFLANNNIVVTAMLPTTELLPKLLAADPKPRLALIDIDPNPAETLQTLGPLIRQFPATNFFLMSRTVDATLLMDAMHLGVREFLPLPVNREKLLASIERIADADGLAPAARILHFIPASGGCGCTTLACNVAASLARHAKTLLLDLDLTRGNAATAFDLRPRYSISDLMDSSAPLDKALLDTALAFHPPTGLAILARPEFPEEAQRVTPQGLARLLGAAGRLFDYIVIDSTLNADPLHCLALREAHVNLLVMQLNVPSAKNAERFLACLRRLGINGEKIKVVVNRFNKRGPDIEPEEVERALGVKISWRVPNDFKTALAATNLGQPLLLRSPRAELSESIAGLSHLLNGKKELVNAE